MMPSIAQGGDWPHATAFHGRDYTRKIPSKSISRQKKSASSPPAGVSRTTIPRPRRSQPSHAVMPQMTSHGNAAQKPRSDHPRDWGCRVEVAWQPDWHHERRGRRAPQVLHPRPDGFEPQSVARSSGAAPESYPRRRESRIHERDQVLAMDLESLGSWSFSEDTSTAGDIASEWAILPAVPSPPLAPQISRLSTPDLSPLATDVEFCPCHGDECVEDKVGDAWYIAGRSKMNSQGKCPTPAFRVRLTLTVSS